MPEAYIRRGSALAPNQNNKPNANTIRVDSGTEELKFGTGASGTTEKTVAATSTSLGLTSASPSAGVGYATGAGGAVTQITSSATAVSLNKVTGQITTVALTTAAGAEEEFTFNNTTIAATDVVVASLTYTGAGTPAVSIKGVAANSCVINITNLHSANALNAVVVINFAVIKAVAA